MFTKSLILHSLLLVVPIKGNRTLKHSLVQLIEGEHNDPKEQSPVKYAPDWPSIDSRPLPKWYDAGKIGIFIHWGIFSAIGKTGAWFWKCWNDGDPVCVDFMKKNYKPNFTYQDFAPYFKAEFFDASEWVELFKKSGAKYVVLTSKHHEGFTMWPSKTSFGWNSLDVGPRRDLVGELAAAVRNKSSLRFGLYHSLYEWFNPLYMEDEKNDFKTDEFVRFKTMPELYELVNNYLPDVVWSDGDWAATDTYWKSKEFIAWLYNESPVKDSVVTNDRWGLNVTCHHGGFLTCTDRYNPGVLQARKWENCITLDKYAWAHRKGTKIEDYLTPQELIETIIETVACGGNILVNVGPTEEGTIIPVQQERLLQMGEWLGINGEAIYGTVPWTSQNDSATAGVWYTYNSKEHQVNAFLTKWPPCGTILLEAVGIESIVNVRMLGYHGELKFSKGSSNGTIIELPIVTKVKSMWAWTIAIQVKAE